MKNNSIFEQRIVSWKVMIATQKEIKYYHFADEESAKLAIEWAYQVRLEELYHKSYCNDVETYPLGTGSTNKNARKLTWWKKQFNGFICNKEYFDYSKEEIIRQVIS